MFPARILSGPPLPFRDLRIEISGREWTATPEYDLLVNAAWHRMREQHSLWDGVYYRVTDPAKLARSCIMRLGLIRYRYIATFPALQDQFVRSGSSRLITSRPSPSFGPAMAITSSASAHEPLRSI